MQALFQEIITDGMIYIAVAFLSFLNIIIPLSGSSTQTPLIAALTGDSHYAIAVSGWLLMISCGMTAFIFRNDIRRDYLWKLSPTSVIGSVLGALTLIQLPNWLVTSVLFFLAVHFLYKKVLHLLNKNKQKEEKKKAHHLMSSAVGLLSGFLQGTGLSGASVRTNFLYSENLKIEEVRGTSNILNFFIFAVASIIRFSEHQIVFIDMFKWTLIFTPILLISVYLGRKVLIKLSDKVKDSIVILTMIYIIVKLLMKAQIIFLALF